MAVRERLCRNCGHEDHVHNRLTGMGGDRLCNTMGCRCPRFEAGRVTQLSDPQEEWFVREVRRYRDLGIPLGCCDEWPECSHIVQWWADHRDDILEGATS